jgi:hypothetical protein
MSYAAIISAIDAAILAWADKPVTLTNNGRTTTYRTMDELLKARDYYTRAGVSSSADPASRLRVARFRSGGTV